MFTLCETGGVFSKLFNGTMGSTHQREGGRTTPWTHCPLSNHQPRARQLALIAIPAWMLIAQIRRAGLVAGIIRAIGGVIAWVIIWYFLTFVGVMIGSMADHYERATDETNDSPYSNTYEDAPANPGEYYDPNEQQ